jgi:predicted TIM-barrel fold metal-dependent hydrolase
VKDIEFVVDMDVHLSEKQDDILPYLEDPFASLLDLPENVDEHGFQGELYPKPGVLSPVATGDVKPETVRDPEDLLAGMEMLDVDASVIGPGLNTWLSAVNHDKLAAGLAHAYNSYLLDVYLDNHEELYGAVAIAPQRPHNAAEEIRERANERGIVAVYLPGGGLHPPLGDEKYYPIFEACEDTGLPMLIHNGGTITMQNFPYQFQGLKRYLGIHAIGHPFTHITNLVSMIIHGIPVRYPDVDIVMQESGIGWIPYIMRRLDHEYASKKHDAPMLEKLPSEYILDQFYFTSQPIEGTSDPEYVGYMARLFEAENNLMFSSDYPHLDFDTPNELINLLKHEFSDDEINNIYGQTATEILDI